MSSVLGILILAGLVFAVVKYQSFKLKGFRPRTFHTTLDPVAVRAIFEQKIAGMGWSIADSGNPMIAQSGLLSGIRQQIALTVEVGPQGVRGRIAVLRYSKKVFGGATKAHTLRLRMNNFLAELRRADAAVQITG